MMPKKAKAMNITKPVRKMCKLSAEKGWNETNTVRSE